MADLAREQRLALLYWMQLTRTFDGGLHRSEPIVDMALYVLKDHDRIVDDKSNCQHNRKQGEKVKREPEAQHDRRCADERERNCNYRNQH